ncbi:ribonuclease T2 family protein [Tsuneonella sp. HG249]
MAALAIGTTARAQAQAYQCRVPTKVSVPQIRPDGLVRRVPIAGYTLALSWSPEYCKGRETNAGDAVQCSGANGRFGMIVHGLWPEGRGEWSQWCPAIRKLQPPELKRNLCMMPSARMLAHEWAKHGACMTRTPASYFKVTRILFEGLRLPDFDRLSKDPELSAGLIRTRFAAANPGWRADAVGLVVNERGWLREMRLCYDKRFMPQACDRRRFGPGDAARVKIWRGL